MMLLTLCLIKKDRQILLGYKKRGFGVHRWNGFGGKLDQGETIEKAAKREVLEEVEIKVNKLEEVGIAYFYFPDDPEILEVHIFKSEDWSGEPQETEEMKPQWFDIDKIPYDQMWDDDRYWFPWFLQNKKFKAHFYFDKYDKVKDHKIEAV